MPFVAWLDVTGTHHLLRAQLVTLVFPALALILWRVWRFTISPILHPEEPQEVPYWIPFLGHARSFLQNQDQALSYGREYFKNTREPFAITLGTEKLYILTSYDDVVAAYKNNSTLDYGYVIQDLLASFGVSRPGIEKIFDPNPHFLGDIRRYNPHHKSFYKLKSDFYHSQLHPGPHFDVIQEKLLGLMDDAMKHENLTDDIMLDSESSLKKASLYKWCQKVFVKAGIRTFFGERILEMDPHFLHHFIDFDDNNWMIFYNWPKAAIARNAKSKVLQTLEAYLSLPKAERQGAAWLIETLEESQKQLGMKEADTAVVLMMIMWVVNTNAYRVVFWMLTYTLHSATLLKTLHDETEPSLRADGSVDLAYLVANSPHLDSLWLEVLRLTNASSGIRTVLAPTRIGNKVLKPGYKVMSPFRQLHFDEEVFGTDASQCNPDRFLHHKDLARHPSYKPFGGGVHMCPGRFVARQEVFVFVTLLLHRFHGKLTDGEQAFPRFELETPTTGIISPKIGDDVIVAVEGKAVAT